MFKQLLTTSIAAAALFSSISFAANPDVTAMIKNADNYRLDESSAKVVSEVKLYQNGELDKTRQYHVYTRPDRESLVLFKSQVEAGQKMLMLGDNYWLLMPKSRRPIRITPMQKLLGEASVGDISTLTWSEDYQGEWVGETQVEIANSDLAPITANQLKLIAKTGARVIRPLIYGLMQVTIFQSKRIFTFAPASLLNKLGLPKGTVQVKSVWWK